MVLLLTVGVLCKEVLPVRVAAGLGEHGARLAARPTGHAARVVIERRVVLRIVRPWNHWAPHL